VLAGEISAEGIVARLREIEGMRTTGVVVFEDGQQKREVLLVAGQVAGEQLSGPDGLDPVERLLSLRKGRFEVFQRLPVLPVSSGDAARRTGSLGVHVPADLMNYCERAGLTGVLTLDSEGRAAEMLYDGGELLGIRVDGAVEDDIGEVFSWDEGTFVVEALASLPDLGVELVPEPALPPQAASGGPLLRVVEVTLASILEQRESRRPGSHTGPPIPVLAAARASLVEPVAAFPPEEVTIPVVSKRPERTDATVRVIYLGKGSRTAPSKTTAAPSPEAPSAQERPPSRAKPKEEAPMSTPNEAPAHAPRPSMISALAWMGFALLCAFVSLAIVAKLPPLE
jgi:hypothetical protein